MNNHFKSYKELLKHKGRSLSELNPGSDELALSLDDAEAGVEILRKNQSVIFGGDIMSTDSNGVLVYAYQKWGSEYHYLSWSCEKASSENESDYRNKSYDLAIECIERAKLVSEQLGETCYVVLVT